jgi:hypothetical protein
MEEENGKALVSNYRHSHERLVRVAERKERDRDVLPVSR